MIRKWHILQVQKQSIRYYPFFQNNIFFKNFNFGLLFHVWRKQNFPANSNLLEYLPSYIQNETIVFWQTFHQLWAEQSFTGKTGYLTSHKDHAKLSFNHFKGQKLTRFPHQSHMLELYWPFWHSLDFLGAFKDPLDAGKHALIHSF